MVLPIRVDGDAVLRETAKPVPEALFGTPELKKILDDMADTVDKEADGVAIAAPQVGISYRIFLVRYDRMLPAPKEGEPPHAADVGVFVNPEIIRRSRKNAVMEEGCLSVRNIYGKTTRKDRATVRAYDENGKKFERGAGGILAQAFQHEVDHLDGILFIDHATDIVQIKEEDRDAEREARRERRATAAQSDE